MSNAYVNGQFNLYLQACRTQGGEFFIKAFEMGLPVRKSYNFIMNI